jgi:hypothetical protein
LTGDKLSDALREHIRAEMLTGKVVGSSGAMWPDDERRRITWETDPKYAGMGFRLPDGTVIQHRVQLTKDGKTMSFPAGDADAARADGWK